MNSLELKALLHAITKDRMVMGLIIALIAVSLAFCVYIGISVHSSSAQVVVRYTGYGSTHFYRDHWTYLFSFVGFGIVTAVLNGAIGAKFVSLERRALAVAWLIGSIGIVVVAAILIHAVVGVKYL